MEHKSLYHALPFLKELPLERREEFEEYFKSAPVWLMDSFQIEEAEKGTVLVRANEPVDTIYFIGRGNTKGTDYRMYGIVYDFLRFDKVHAIGGMEVLMDLDTYRTTIETITRCTVVKLSRTKYEKWMLSDIRVMKLESKRTCELLLEDGRNSRAYLFLQGSNRLAMLLTGRYEKYAKKGILQLSGGRQELSDATGLCVKTINRSVKKFSEEGLITKKGNQILVDEGQYRTLKEIVDALVDTEK